MDFGRQVLHNVMVPWRITPRKPDLPFEDVHENDSKTISFENKVEKQSSTSRTIPQIF